MVVLRKVQLEALRLAQGKSGYLWGLDCGLGKTIVALTEFERLRAAGIATHLLVLCPKSVISIWYDEIKRHGIAIADHEILIKNYEACLSKASCEILAFCRHRQVLLICDESHRLKDFRTKTVRWITANLQPAVIAVRCLTGTPLAESPMDLFSQLRLCHGTVGINPYVWRNRWCIMGGWKDKQVIGVRDREQLIKYCEPYIFRARKADWAKDLPEKTFITQRVEMTPEQQKIYKDMRQQFVAELKGKIISSSMALTVMLRMGQISAGFVKTDDGLEIEINPGNNPKIVAAVEWAEQFKGGNKFVIVAINVFVVKILLHRLQIAGINAIGLYGDANVEEAKNKFNEDDSVDGIVLSIKKGSLGLTLLGSKNRPCSDLLHVQSAFSYIDRIQANDRIHRIGQHYPVSYTDLIASPLDNKILSALKRKGDASDAILDFLRESVKEYA